MSEKNHTPDATRWPRGLRALLSLLVLLGIMSVLPWAGIGYCVVVGSTACPAILSPEGVQIADRAPGSANPPLVTTTTAPGRSADSAGTPPPLQTIASTTGNLPTANPDYVALVIGNSNYGAPNTPLKNPRNDALAIAAAFKNLNYTLVGGDALLDLDDAQMRRAVIDFKVQAARAKVAIVYYAGHGIQVDDSEPIFLIPVNAKLQRKEELEIEAIPLSFVTAALPKGHALDGSEQYGLVILDACRTSNFPLQGVDPAKRGTVQRGLKAVKAPERAFVAFSASPGQPASDGDGTNSPYATSLLKHMNPATEEPDIKTVFDRVDEDFRSNGEDQTPGKSDRLGDRKVTLAAPQKPRAVGWKGRDCPECPEIVVLQAGTFRMGAPKDEPDSSDDERPQRDITIAKPFGIGTHEVTFAEWDACVKAGGCKYKPDGQGLGRGDRPVINVSWLDAQIYVRWLSVRTHNRYRLLSEAEWEYAARAGTRTAYPWGPKASHEFANYNGVEGRDKWGEQTAPAGQFPPNKLGLYDMHGNVWEWVTDCYGPYDPRKLDGDPVGVSDETCSSRVLRGGSWLYGPQDLRSAGRDDKGTPSLRFVDSGFRVARTL